MAILMALLLGCGPARSNICDDAGHAAEHAFGLPDGLLVAIGQVETGQLDALGRVSPWPWAVNANGLSYLLDSSRDALSLVRALQAAGVGSIDVGCFQVNLHFHPSAFPDLSVAFDPAANAAAAATFLMRLFSQTGSWPLAAARYHSATPGVGEAYAAQVMARWHAAVAPAVAGQAAVVPRVVPRGGPMTPGMRYLAVSGGAGVSVAGRF